MAKTKTDILNLFSEKKETGTYLNISAPMVRYSKLEFRKLLRKYKTDLCFTPMIIADSFCRSEKARKSEFTTSHDDMPLIAQFAAKNDVEFQNASELVYQYADGIDINCGCPQSWAISKSYGCALLKKPEVIQDMIKSVKRVMPQTFSCSVKMRLLQKNDVKSTIDLCRQLEHCGASFISVHSRTPWQKSSEPVDINSITEIKKSLKIPLVYNGDVKTKIDADTAYKLSQCDGIMSARGLLSNPTLFTGTRETTNECLQDWINIGAAADSKITFQCFHHHLTFMMEKLTTKKTRSNFNNFSKKAEVFEFMQDYYNIKVQKNSKTYKNYMQNMHLNYDNDICEKYNSYINKNKTSLKIEDNEWNENNDGKYFLAYKNSISENNYEEDQFSFMGSSLFD